MNNDLFIIGTCFKVIHVQSSSVINTNILDDTLCNWQLVGEILTFRFNYENS